MDFEWHPEKERINLDDHGVSFGEAMTVFGDPLEVTIADPDHSEGEFRYISIGRFSAARLLVVAYTERGEHIRIISARQATPRERRQHETDS